MSPGLNLYFLLVVRSYRYSLEDEYNRRQNAANVYVSEQSNIKRMPLEEPICKQRSYLDTCQPVHRLRFCEIRLLRNI